MAKPKEERNKKVIELWKAGQTAKQIAEKIGISEGGTKGLLSRLAVKNLIQRGAKAETPEKQKAAKPEIEKLVVKTLDTQSLEKRKVGYVIPELLAQKLDLYRVQNRKMSRSEIITQALENWLKEKEKKE